MFFVIFDPNLKVNKMEEKLIFENDTHIVTSHGGINPNPLAKSSDGGWYQKVETVWSKDDKEHFSLNDLTDHGYIKNISLNKGSGLTIEYSKEKTKDVPERPVRTQFLIETQRMSFLEIIDKTNSVNYPPTTEPMGWASGVNTLTNVHL